MVKDGRWEGMFSALKYSSYSKASKVSIME